MKTELKRFRVYLKKQTFTKLTEYSTNSGYSLSEILEDSFLEKMEKLDNE